MFVPMLSTEILEKWTNNVDLQLNEDVAKEINASMYTGEFKQLNLVASELLKPADMLWKIWRKFAFIRMQCALLYKVFNRQIHNHHGYVLLNTLYTSFRLDICRIGEAFEIYIYMHLILSDWNPDIFIRKLFSVVNWIWICI